MSYKFSNITGKIYDINNNLIKQDDIELLTWLNNGNKIEFYDFFEFEKEEIERFQPTIAKQILIDNNINLIPNRDIDILVDTYEFFRPKTKVYDNKGFPLHKDYVYINKLNEEILVCRISYHKVYKNLELYGIVKNELVGLYSKFTFYRYNSIYNEEKIIETQNFDLIPTVIFEKDANGNSTEKVIDILWSSEKRNEILYEARKKVDQIMNTFNPALYNMLTGLFQQQYTRYLTFGDKTQLINDLISSQIPKLQEQVEDDDKIAIGIPVNYNLTILELIIGNLQ
jgi:hypothetical protein